MHARLRWVYPLLICATLMGASPSAHAAIKCFDYLREVIGLKKKPDSASVAKAPEPVQAPAAPRAPQIHSETQTRKIKPTDAGPLASLVRLSRQGEAEATRIPPEIATQIQPGQSARYTFAEGRHQDTVHLRRFEDGTWAIGEGSNERLPESVAAAKLWHRLNDIRRDLMVRTTGKHDQPELAQWAAAVPGPHAQELTDLFYKERSIQYTLGEGIISSITSGPKPTEADYKALNAIHYLTDRHRVAPQTEGPIGPQLDQAMAAAHVRYTGQRWVPEINTPTFEGHLAKANQASSGPLDSSILSILSQASGTAIPAGLETAIPRGSEARLYFGHGDRKVRLTIRHNSDGTWSSAQTGHDRPYVDEGFVNTRDKSRYTLNEAPHLYDPTRYSDGPAAKLKYDIERVRQSLMKDEVIDHFPAEWAKWFKAIPENARSARTLELFLRGQKMKYELGKGFVSDPSIQLTEAEARQLAAIKYLSENGKVFYSTNARGSDVESGIYDQGQVKVQMLHLAGIDYEGQLLNAMKMANLEYRDGKWVPGKGGAASVPALAAKPPAAAKPPTLVRTEIQARKITPKDPGPLASLVRLSRQTEAESTQMPAEIEAHLQPGQSGRYTFEGGGHRATVSIRRFEDGTWAIGEGSPEPLPASAAAARLWRKLDDVRQELMTKDLHKRDREELAEWSATIPGPHERELAALYLKERSIQYTLGEGVISSVNSGPKLTDGDYKALTAIHYLTDRHLVLPPGDAGIAAQIDQGMAQAHVRYTGQRWVPEVNSPTFDGRVARQGRSASQAVDPTLLSHLSEVSDTGIPAALETAIPRGSEARLYFGHGNRKIRLTVRHGSDGTWRSATTAFDQRYVDENYIDAHEKGRYTLNEKHDLEYKTVHVTSAAQLKRNVENIRRMLMREEVIDRFEKEWSKWAKSVPEEARSPETLGLFLKGQKMKYELGKGFAPDPAITLTESEAKQLAAIRYLEEHGKVFYSTNANGSKVASGIYAQGQVKVGTFHLANVDYKAQLLEAMEKAHLKYENGRWQ